jgi:hypothetical protein
MLERSEFPDIAVLPKFTVHHEPSTIAADRTVYRLYLTSISKP